MRSEIFSQGTLMLRLVIQVSMFLAVPLMAVCLYWRVDLAPWYICYVVLFNVLVGPVFSAGGFTGERERQTLDLLLTTTISPWQIVWGKLVAALRVSGVLTSFVAWPLLWAWLLGMIAGTFGQRNFWAVPAYLAIILAAGSTTTILALFCSVLCKKTSTSLMSSYLVIGTIFCLPLAARTFVDAYAPGAPITDLIETLGVISPFAAALHIPLMLEIPNIADRVGSWSFFFYYLGFSVALDAVLLIAIQQLFDWRWRNSE
jgi:ABC-type Na+ efflux pump permease subunit